MCHAKFLSKASHEAENQLRSTVYGLCIYQLESENGFIQVNIEK